MAQGLDKAERRRKPGRSGRWLPSSWLAFALVALTLPGYVSAAGSRAGKRIQPGGLGPLPTYPPETAGWDTSQILMVYPCSGLSSDSRRPVSTPQGQSAWKLVCGNSATLSCPVRLRCRHGDSADARSSDQGDRAPGQLGSHSEARRWRIGREVVFMVRVAKPKTDRQPPRRQDFPGRRPRRLSYPERHHRLDRAATAV